MPAMRRCLDCRQAFEGRGPRCRDCARTHDAARRGVYDDPAYRKLRARVIRRHVATYGPWCPGYGVPAHVSHELTLDHAIPLAHGGEGLDERNARVLCKTCNSRKRDA